MATPITPDLARGGYRSTGRPESNSDSDSLYSITSSDPIPEANRSGKDAKATETPAPAPPQIPTPAPTPAPTQTREGGGDEENPGQPLPQISLLFRHRDPENVQPVKDEAPFTTEEIQAAQTLNAARVEQERRQMVLAGFMRINRNFQKGEEALGNAQTTNEDMHACTRYREIIRFNMQNQAAQQRSQFAAANRLNNLATRFERLYKKMQDTGEKVEKGKKSWTQQLDTITNGATTMKDKMLDTKREANAKLNHMNTNFDTVKGEVKNLQTMQTTISNKVGGMSTTLMQQLGEANAGGSSLQDSQGTILQSIQELVRQASNDAPRTPPTHQARPGDHRNAVNGVTQR